MNDDYFAAIGSLLSGITILLVLGLVAIAFQDQGDMFFEIKSILGVVLGVFALITLMISRELMNLGHIKSVRKEEAAERKEAQAKLKELELKLEKLKKS